MSVGCRVSSSSQSHQLKAGKHKKAKLPVGFFCACRSAVLPFFPPFIEEVVGRAGNDSNLLIVFYVQIMPDDFVMQLGTVAKLAMRQPFVLFKGLTFQKLCLP
ncbi:hypothetical protein NPY94_23650, partial [Salmonella enterica]|nr:hypothetical protein [Salmonella enterica]